VSGVELHGTRLLRAGVIEIVKPSRDVGTEDGQDNPFWVNTSLVSIDVLQSFFPFFGIVAAETQVSAQSEVLYSRYL
jgi:hypothetical protein